MLHAVVEASVVVRPWTVCAFGGAGGRRGRDPRLAEAAVALGTAIADAGMRLVYGGGTDGLMGGIACAATRRGGEVVAIVPSFIAERLQLPRWLGQAILVPDMHMRKRLMFEYADAFVALPGGIGTIEELSEVMTLGKLDRHAKPILIANFEGFWTPWLALLAHMQAEGFLCASVLARCAVAERAEDVLALLTPDPAAASR